MNNRINAISLAQHEKLSSIDRGYYFLLHSLSDIRYGKDIRLFDAKDMMTHRVDSYNLEQSKITKDQAMQSQKFLYGSKLDMALTTILTYIILTIMAVKGIITLGEFTMLAASGAAIAASMNMVLVQILDLQKFTRYAEKCVNFLENNDFEESGNLPCACDDSMEIEFKNVSFRYPGSEEYAITNINVKIHKGEHLSIVGLNGAGKTTFIKLLCRFYECTEGEITLNGFNILEYDITSYRKLLAAVFQDFQLLGFSIKENIITGDPADVSDEKVNEIIKEVGLSEKVSSLSAGTDTCVFRYYDLNGFEPSGGEQQKLAMARALYKDAPVLILDEPTAALDPIAEKEVYEKFNEMTDGKTALFISHRLSSCKFCDSILVFKEGRIVERGTHSSLVSLPGGLYSQMFHAQAQYYA
jgi:ATP-binding cassette subfamily C protein